MTRSDRMKIRRLVERKTIQEIAEAKRRIETTAYQMRIAEARMIKRGVPRSRINEGLMDIASNLLNVDAIADVVKKYIINSIMNMLGFSGGPGDPIYSFFQNLFEAVDYSELTKYFGEDNCGAVMDLLTEAITETVTEYGSAKLLSYFVTSQGLTGFAGSVADTVLNSLGGIGQETLNEVVVEVVKGLLEEPVREYICGKSLSDIIGIDGLDQGLSGLLGLAGKGGEFLSDLGGIVGKASEYGLSGLGVGGN